jgi:SpoVK/Ycf46/Vps4 family AAA+-type ATPase
LGETVKNIRNAFEVARAVALERGSFILFFDEIDSIASERANAHEVGEIKRAVVSFLQIIDKITYEGVPLAIVGATNHQDQLDSAVWRRFIYHLEFEFPDASMRYEILNNYLERVQRAGIEVDVPLRSDLAAAVSTWNRQKKLVGLLKTTDGFTGADIERAMLMAIWRSLRGGVLKYADLEETLLTAGGTRIHVDQQHTLSKALAGQPSSGGGSGEDIDEY